MSSYEDKHAPKLSKNPLKGGHERLLLRVVYNKSKPDKR